jgi:hypothetical protein
MYWQLSRQAFTLDASPLALLVLQQAQGRPHQDTQVRRDVAYVPPQVVLPEGHVQLPGQVILDPPVPAHRCREPAATQVVAQDVITHLPRLLPVPLRAVDD